jgi:SAM-dependent methyltransferase
MADYALTISEVELMRYRIMAERARADEADLLSRAGVVPGATIADVGCGPAAMAVALAELVVPGGRVIGIERDAASREVAAQVVAAAGAANLEVHEGEATATGIGAGSVDVAVMRHVLAHNGGSEQEIVNHLAELVRPGGSVYLVDTDLTGMRLLHGDSDLDDLTPTYAAFHRARGNDPMIGLRLGELLAAAGLSVEAFRGSYNIIQVPPGMRPPSWAARDVMVAEGAVDQATVDRWGAALDRTDEQADRPTLFAPAFIAIGRR